MLLACTVAAFLATIVAGGACLLAAVRRACSEPRAARRDQLAFAFVLLALAVFAWRQRWVATVAHHAVYVDEPWYVEAASSLIHRGSALLCDESWSGP